MILQTEYLQAGPSGGNMSALNRAAQLLQDSELVAFPTETVYGVGAGVSDEEAVRKIFAVKGRSGEQALLVHISALRQLSGIVSYISPDARLLMEEFWPGPLSIILPVHKDLSPVITGGKTTVGLRMPSHPVAQKLIDITGPLAATSANRSGRPSPLTAEHVRADLNGMIAAIVEGGPAVQGIESTIIDLSRDQYFILRRGSIPVSAVERVLGKPLSISSAAGGPKEYLTSCRLEIARNEEDFRRRLAENQRKSLGIISFAQTERTLLSGIYDIRAEYVLAADERGSEFFSVLRDAEQKNLDVLLVAPLPDSISESLRDRISRAAAGDG